MIQMFDRERNQLSYDARPFYPRDGGSSEDRGSDYEPLAPAKQALGERLFPRVLALQPVSVNLNEYIANLTHSLTHSVTHRPAKPELNYAS